MHSSTITKNYLSSTNYLFISKQSNDSQNLNDSNSNNPSGHSNTGGPGGGGISASSSFKPQAMQQQHAISYVTQIRNRFANEPETYRAFLKILHT